MKLLSVFFIAMLFVVVAGCDGDGTPATTETTTEETQTAEETKTPVTIASGSATVPVDNSLRVCYFSVFETGIIEGRLEWSAGPTQLYIALVHESGAYVEKDNVESPATIQMQATQGLLNDSNDWGLYVINPDTVESVTVNFTVRLTPD